MDISSTNYMSSNLILIIIASSLMVLFGIGNRKRRTRRMPRFRVHPYLQSRNLRGRFVTDFQDLLNYEHFFEEAFHMSVDQFEELYRLVLPYLIPKRHTRPDDAISPMLKLCICLEFFASGSFQRQLASSYRVSKQHLGKIIDDVCNAIIGNQMTKMPALTKTNFVQIANSFNTKWNFPNCIGAIDGKHVAIKAPPKAGSLCYNHKGHHSLVLLAICDAFYKFTYIDVGAYGSEGDANIFRKSKFGQRVINDALQFPEDASIAGVKLPYVFVADDAFALCKRIMKPYGKQKLTNEERIFNYRLSRARRCIENAFGVLTMKWPCVQRTLLCEPDRAQKIITACCLLHNFLIDHNDRIYCPEKLCDRLDEFGNLVEGEWRLQSNSNDNLWENINYNRGRPTDLGKYVRDKFKDYFNASVGSVPWQNAAAGIN